MKIQNRGECDVEAGNGEEEEIPKNILLKDRKIFTSKYRPISQVPGIQTSTKHGLLKNKETCTALTFARFSYLNIPSHAH
ncbi:hypothetical protein A4H02_08735 [Fervidobacterium thailandense]|uniref:Uncharacterized protein n=1 Tax=Fervidobacterium thailandense TaxID=1008305 RepID=A0A1E3G0Q6_9BACT|nr:hypothetical protein A4H02_08735 [Fervidobacterium thailandense]